MKRATKHKRLVFGEAVEVVWADTTGHAGWMGLHEPKLLPVKVAQLGYFIYQDKETLLICQGIPSDAAECQIVAPTAIPRGCVKSIRRVR